MENTGFIELYNSIKNINDKAIKYNEGLGVLDTGVISSDYKLKTGSIPQELSPGEYMVSSNLLGHECETEYSGQYIEKIDTKVKNRFKPGTYLILYLGNYPVVLTELVRGDQAIE